MGVLWPGATPAICIPPSYLAPSSHLPSWLWKNSEKKKRCGVAGKKKTDNESLCEKAFSKMICRTETHRKIYATVSGWSPESRTGRFNPIPTHFPPPPPHFLKVSHLTLVILLRRAQLPCVYRKGRRLSWKLATGDKEPLCNWMLFSQPLNWFLCVRFLLLPSMCPNWVLETSPSQMSIQVSHLK